MRHSSSYSTIYSLFSTDSHRTKPASQSNRPTRNTTYIECSTTKQSNTSCTTLLFIQQFINYFSQTLTTIDFGSNKIGDLGAQYLANVIQQNKVTQFPPHFFSLNILLQTLTTLKLDHNHIGSQGAQYLASALQQNKVTQSALFFLLFNNLLDIFRRHSSHLILGTIKLAIKEHSI
jgi:hypothetical protein